MAKTSRHVALWLVAFSFAATMVGTTLPTPLYVYYQRLFGFSNLTSTVIFAAYAVGVLAALLLLGRASDAIGRRPVLLAGLLCAGASAVVFLRAHDLALLITARVLSGLSAGIFTGTATATIVDLADEHTRERATLIATVANMGGLGAGPLVAGLIVRFSASPLEVPFELHLALMAAAAISLWIIPEPVTRERRVKFAITKPRVPDAVRATFTRASMAGFAGFAVLGLFTAVSPALVRRVIGLTDPALAGAIACGIFAASAFGQIVLTGRFGKRALSIGCAILVAGMGLLAIAIAAGSLALLIAAAALAGIGQGISFRAGLAALAAEAAPAQRAEVASTFFVVAYLAISVPVVGVGLAADRLGLRTAGIVFSLAIGLLALVTLLALRRRTT